MPCNYRNREKGKKRPNRRVLSFFFTLGTDFIGRDLRTSIIREKKYFPDYGKYQIRWQGFLEAGCYWTRSAPSALHFVQRCLQSALSRRPKLCFGPEKLINSTVFAARGNNTLELISN